MYTQRIWNDLNDGDPKVDTTVHLHRESEHGTAFILLSERFHVDYISLPDSGLNFRSSKSQHSTHPYSFIEISKTFKYGIKLAFFKHTSEINGLAKKSFSWHNPLAVLTLGYEPWPPFRKLSSIYHNHLFLGPHNTEGIRHSMAICLSLVQKYLATFCQTFRWDKTRVRKILFFFPFLKKTQSKCGSEFSVFQKSC